MDRTCPSPGKLCQLYPAAEHVGLRSCPHSGLATCAWGLLVIPDPHKPALLWELTALARVDGKRHQGFGSLTDLILFFFFLRNLYLSLKLENVYKQKQYKDHSLVKLSSKMQLAFSCLFFKFM